MLYEGGTFLEVVNSIWSFFQDQILGMRWFKGPFGSGESLLGLDINSRLGGSIQFFLYDVIKIIILLCLLILLIRLDLNPRFQILDFSILNVSSSPRFHDL